MLPHIGEKILCVNQQRWSRYLRKITSYANSERCVEADYEQRLMKLIDIVYLPEELDVIAAKE